MGHMTRAIAVAAALLLVIAAPARADDPTFGGGTTALTVTMHGQFATVSLGCNGSGHVTWNSGGTEISPVVACSLLETITITGTQFADAVDLHLVATSGQFGAMQSTTFNG